MSLTKKTVQGRTRCGIRAFQQTNCHTNIARLCHHWILLLIFVCTCRNPTWHVPNLSALLSIPSFWSSRCNWLLGSLSRIQTALCPLHLSSSKMKTTAMDLEMKTTLKIGPPIQIFFGPLSPPWKITWNFSWWLLTMTATTRLMVNQN